MTIELAAVTIDCTDPRALAVFWTEALGVQIAADYGGEYLVLTPHRPGAAQVGLQRVDEARAGKNRVHLDLSTDDREGETDRLVGLGATILDEHAVPGLEWTVLADPDGNEFCVGQGTHD